MDRLDYVSMPLMNTRMSWLLKKLLQVDATAIPIHIRVMFDEIQRNIKSLLWVVSHNGLV